MTPKSAAAVANSWATRTMDANEAAESSIWSGTAGRTGCLDVSAPDGNDSARANGDANSAGREIASARANGDANPLDLDIDVDTGKKKDAELNSAAAATTNIFQGSSFSPM